MKKNVIINIIVILVFVGIIIGTISMVSNPMIINAIKHGGQEGGITNYETYTTIGATITEFGSMPTCYNIKEKVVKYKDGTTIRYITIRRDTGVLGDMSNRETKFVIEGDDWDIVKYVNLM